MADTPRSWADLETLLADNTAQGISEQDLRDAFQTFRSHGFLYIDGNSTGQVLSTTYEPVENMSALDGNVGTTLDAASAKITVTATGLYLISYSLSAAISTSTNTLRAMVSKNGSTTVDISGSLCQQYTGDTNNHNLDRTFVASLTAADYVQLMISAASSTPTYTLKDAGLTVKRIA